MVSGAALVLVGAVVRAIIQYDSKVMGWSYAVERQGEPLRTGVVFLDREASREDICTQVACQAGCELPAVQTPGWKDSKNKPGWYYRSPELPAIVPPRSRGPVPSC